MTDIVKRLRIAVNSDQPQFPPTKEEVRALLDEIERLRGENEVTAADLHAWMKLKADAEARLAEADLVIQRLNSGAELQAIMAAHNETLARLAEAVEALRNLAEASREVGLRLFEYSDLSEVVERMRLAMIAALDVAAKLEQKP